MNRDPGIQASAGLEMFDSWADAAAGGQDDLRRILIGAIIRFMARHGHRLVHQPAPGFRLLLRLDRSAAMVRESGAVTSAEFLHIPDMDRFHGDESYRAIVLSAAKWDDRAALFTPVAPPKQLSTEESIFDWDGQRFAEMASDQVRRIEYLMSHDITSGAHADAIFAPLSPLSQPASPGQRPLPGTGPAPRRPGAAARAAATLGPVRRLKADLRDRLVAAIAGLKPMVMADLDVFRSLLAADGLKAMTAAGENSIDAYNWLMAVEGHHAGPQAELSKRRIQAVAAYPVAMPLMAAKTGPVAHAVRDATPLNPALAQALATGEGTVRRMNGLTKSGAGMFLRPGMADSQAALARVAAQVARMPPGVAPRTDTGWQSYFEAVALADWLNSRLQAGGAAADATQAGQADAALTFLRGLAGRWDGLNPDLLAQARTGGGDMLLDLRATLLTPLTRRAEGQGWRQHEADRFLLSGRTILQLADMVDWWHEQRAAIHVRLADAFPTARRAAGLVTWPPLHPGDWMAPNGFRVRELCSKEELDEEHLLMQHCVDTYAGRCLFSGTHILTVRQPGVRTPAGTVEIAQADILKVANTMTEFPEVALRSNPPGVVQFKAFKNAPPDNDAWRALWAYIGAILTGELELDAARLGAELDRRQAARDSHANENDIYDDAAPGALAEAWRLYAPLLPRRPPERWRPLLSRTPAAADGAGPRGAAMGVAEGQGAAQPDDGRPGAVPMEPVPAWAP